MLSYYFGSFQLSWIQSFRYRTFLKKNLFSFIGILLTYMINAYVNRNKMLRTVWYRICNSKNNAISQNRFVKENRDYGNDHNVQYITWYEFIIFIKKQSTSLCHYFFYFLHSFDSILMRKDKLLCYLSNFSYSAISFHELIRLESYYTS